MHEPCIAAFEPFDLPEWIGDDSVVWHSDGEGDSAATITGHLTSPRGATLRLDLRAIDVAAPRPSFPQDQRTVAHAAWGRGQVEMYLVDDVVTCAVPTVEFSADLVCETIRRVAKAVGARPSMFGVLLKL